MNGTLIQLLTSKESKIIVLFSLKVQTCAPATHVCMGQRAPTYWMVTLAHARHILQAQDARFLSVSRLIYRWKLLQLSLERDRLNYHAFVEPYITRVRLLHILVASIGVSELDSCGKIHSNYTGFMFTVYLVSSSKRAASLSTSPYHVSYLMQWINPRMLYIQYVQVLNAALTLWTTRPTVACWLHQLAL